MLKFVVKIMIALAEGEERHQQRIARTASRGVRLPAHGVTRGVDEESAMLNDDRLRHSAEKQSAEGAVPAIPEPADQRRQNHSNRQANPMDVAMLPHNEGIFL